MAFLNRSRPTSGIVALVGAIIGLPSMGTFVYTEVQKAKTYTSEVAVCKSAEYQFNQVMSDANEKLDAHLNYTEPGLFGQFRKQCLKGDYILTMFQLGQDKVAHGITMKYLHDCPSELLEKRRDHDYYSTSAPYWACAAFTSLAIAGIGLTINRRKEE